MTNTRIITTAAGVALADRGTPATASRDKRLVFDRLAADRGARPGVPLPSVRYRQPPAAPEHLAMLDAYRRKGGLVSCDEAAMLLRRHHDQPISVLARWIVARKLVSFVWQSETLVPLFQFELADMSLRAAASDVVAELAGAFDDLELAAWFTRPNCWLGNAAPVDTIEADAPAVLQAARADRYIARS
jgi:hypothetical protein